MSRTKSKKAQILIVKLKDLVNKRKNTKLSLSAKDIYKNNRIPKFYYK